MCDKCDQLYITFADAYEKRLRMFGSLYGDDYCAAVSIHRETKAAQDIIHGQQDTLDTADVDAATHNRMVTDRLERKGKNESA